jgi:hypothetical protein
VLQHNLKILAAEKNKRVKQAQEMFSNLFKTVQKPVSTVKRTFDLEASMKTLRRIGLFGEVFVQIPGSYNPLANSVPNKIDFEWPTQDDAEDLPSDNPIKLVGFKFKEDEKVRAICALQLLFSNGSSSPLFLAKRVKGDNLKRVDLDQREPVQSIRGDAPPMWIKQIYFLDSKGKQLAKLFSSADNDGQVFELNPGEEVIGVYGNKNSFNCFINLGFIAWTPKFR